MAFLRATGARTPRVHVVLQPIADKILRMAEVTQILEAANRGDRQATADLLTLVYDELRGSPPPGWRWSVPTTP